MSLVMKPVGAHAHRGGQAGGVRSLEPAPAGLFPCDLSLDQATGQVMLSNVNPGTVEEFPVPGA